MRDAGVGEFIEVGGKVLGPMITRSAGPDVRVTNVMEMADIEALLALV
jgi:[acyl-carrier-protein] S-malonyltransferase